MASPQSESPRPASSTAPAEPNWTDQVTDLVVDLVDSVRDKTTGPVLKAARGLVFGTISLVVLFVVGIVGLILAGRAIALLPIAEWISYLVLGLVFCTSGFLIWGKRFAS
ncbi:MAG: hypothetical protein U0Q22_00280 [Acidimicrobiales bacterium]